MSGISILMASILLLATSGCDLTKNQIKVIAQNSGLGVAVTWIAYDDPDHEEIELVKNILTIIKEKAVDVQSGLTYTQVLFPYMEQYLEKAIEEGTIPAQYKPLVLAGSLAMLSGIDLLFAMHPEWQDDQELALDVVDSFVLGAVNGLSLSDDDPRMTAARNVSSTRARMYIAPKNNQ